jgi:prepilin-type processing-associated H-X9-DG protein
MPPTYLAAGQPATGSAQLGGWGFQILPYIEQDALYAAGKAGGPWNGQSSLGGKALVEVPVKLYWCPSRSDRKSQVTSWGAAYAMSDYAGCRTDWPGQNNSNDPSTYMGIITIGGKVSNGMSTKYGSVTPMSVTDGLSNTLAIMEKAVMAQYYQPSASPWDWWELPGWADGASWPNMRLTGNWIPLLADTAARPSWAYSNGNPHPAEFGFGSAHTGMVNALMGDGSVRGISMSIANSGNSSNMSAANILYNLGHRCDGFPIDAEAF